jgi:hypothetical protein
LVSFFGLYLRDFATHSDWVSPVGVRRCIYLYILDCYCFVLLLLFCLFWDLSYFIHLAFRTHVSSCVRGGINHPWSDLIFLGCDMKSWVQYPSQAILYIFFKVETLKDFLWRRWCGKMHMRVYTWVFIWYSVVKIVWLYICGPHIKLAADHNPHTHMWLHEPHFITLVYIMQTYCYRKT